jgi:hypothetical protein
MKTFKRAFVFGSPILFALMVACGGGGDDPAPPPAAQNSPLENQQVKDMEVQFDRAKKACLGTFAPFLQQVASLPRQGVPAGQPLPPLPQVQDQDCKKELILWLLLLKGIEGGQYYQRGDVQKWAIGKVASIANQVGGALEARGVTLTPELKAKLWGIALQRYQAMFPEAQQQLGSGMAGGINSHVSQYAGLLH